MAPVRMVRGRPGGRARPAGAAVVALPLGSFPKPLVAEAPPEPPVVRAGTAAVLLDVVIRDKKGRPVPDVAAGEIEVFEDGVKQTIEGFRWVATEPASIEAAAPEPPGGPDTRRPPNLVSIVFDQLGPDGRRLAAKAATA